MNVLRSLFGKQHSGKTNDSGGRQDRDRKPDDEDQGGPRVEGSLSHEAEEIFPATEDASDEDLAPVPQFIGNTNEENDDDKVTTRIEIPVRTIVKVVGTLVVIWLLLKVLSIFLLLLLSVLLALALTPPVRRLKNRGMPRVVAAASVYLVLFLLLIGFVALIVPPVVEQVNTAIDNAPEYVESFDDVLDRYPTVRTQVDNYLSDLNPEQDRSVTSDGEEADAPPVDATAVTGGARNVLSIGSAIVGGILNTFFVVVLAFYLLIEGESTWKRLARYMTPKLRYRFHRLGPELTNVVSGYVIGQAINSALFGIFTYVTLLSLGVPQPLLLALLAAITDAIPIAGVPIATIAAMAIALSVSWQTALIVLALYVVYQQFENYILLPRVFGNTLQVSGLSILVGVLVGGQLLGIIGIILSLPVTAAIPVIERVWRERIPEYIDEDADEVADELADLHPTVTAGPE